ncbi:unnamed protein product, partial [Didymodactylos carnosus]
MQIIFCPSPSPEGVSLSWFMAAGLIINAAMGAGLLNIAKAFDEAGFYFAFGQTFCRHWYFDRRFTIPITSLLIIFPLSFSKSMKFLQIPRYQRKKTRRQTINHMYIIFLRYPESWTDVFLVLPTMCFCYQAHVNSVPVFVSLKNRADCIKATLASMLVLIISYSLVAITGYLTFGTK